MKKLLEKTFTIAEDAAQLAHAIENAIARGFTHVFTPSAIAWRANNQYYFEVDNIDEYSWINSGKKEVVVFLLSATFIKGYHVGEFEPT